MEHPRTRRRGAALDEAILQAAWSEMAERGWSEFTVAGVAARCGTNKSVIYRRWSGRIELVQDMLDRATVESQNVQESSGDLRADLVEFLQAMNTFLSGPFGEAVRGLLAERSERASSLTVSTVPAAVRGIMAAALARGDLAHEPPSLIQNVGHSLMMNDLVHAGVPLSNVDIEDVVDQVWLPAIRHGASIGPIPGT